MEATFDQRAKSLRNKPRLMTPNNMDGMLVGGRGGRGESLLGQYHQPDMECEMHHDTINVISQLSLLYLATDYIPRHRMHHISLLRDGASYHAPPT